MAGSSVLAASRWRIPLLAIVAAWRYLCVRPPALAAIGEPVSILKPLAGLDLDLESNLRTFFEQDYPDFEILFAVRVRTIRRWRWWRSCGASIRACPRA